MARVYLADKDTLDTVNNKVGTANDAASATPGSLFAGIKQLISVLSNHVAVWTSARAGKIDKLDLVQTTLNTPNGDTLAAWLKSISDNANAANSNAANAANLASQANNNAWNAYQEAINAKNAANKAASRRVVKADAVYLDAYQQTSIQGNGKAVISNYRTANLRITVDGRVIHEGNRFACNTQNGETFLEIEFLQSVTCEVIDANGNATVRYVLYE